MNRPDKVGFIMPPTWNTSFCFDNEEPCNVNADAQSLIPIRLIFPSDAFRSLFFGGGKQSVFAQGPRMARASRVLAFAPWP